MTGLSFIICMIGREALYCRVSGSTKQESSLANQEWMLPDTTRGRVFRVYRDPLECQQVHETGRRFHFVPAPDSQTGHGNYRRYVSIER